MEREHEKYERLIARCKSLPPRVRFASAVDLLACIARLLADDKSDSAGRAHDRHERPLSERTVRGAVVVSPLREETRRWNVAGSLRGCWCSR